MLMYRYNIKTKDTKIFMHEEKKSKYKSKNNMGILKI